MKALRSYAATVAFLMLIIARLPGGDFMVAWTNLPMGTVATKIERLTGKAVTVEDKKLMRRSFSMDSPRKMDKQEMISLIRAMLAIEGIAWTEADERIILSSYLTDDEIVHLKRSLGVADPKVTYTKVPRRPVIVQPPGK